MIAKAKYKKAHSMFRALKPHTDFVRALDVVKETYGKEIENAVWDVFLQGHERYDFEAWTNSNRWFDFVELRSKALSEKSKR